MVGLQTQFNKSDIYFRYKIYIELTPLDQIHWKRSPFCCRSSDTLKIKSLNIKNWLTHFELKQITGT